MKFIITFLLICVSYLGFTQCIPDSAITAPGVYPIGDSMPCGTQGQQYNTTLTFEIDTSTASPYPLDSISVIDVTNLPCGISWTTNSNVYINGEPGCIQLSGTASDSVGQYKVQIVFQDIELAYIGGDGVPYATDTLIFTKYLQLITTGGNCLVIDTTLAGRISSCNSSIIPPAPPPPVRVSISGKINVCKDSSTQLTASAAGGYGNYHYHWSDGDTTVSTIAISGNTYSVTVTDDSGLFASNSITVNPTSLQITLQYLQTFSCTGTGSANVIINVGTNPFTYHWSNNDSAADLENLPPGSYGVTVTDAAGCTASGSVLINTPCDSVWPGDANDDGVVNYVDIMRIAFSYGNSGAARPNASLQWVGQPADAWATGSIFGNDKFADCDGNGIINADDTLAVALNYTLTHNKTGENIQSQPGDPVLQLVPVVDSIYPNSTFTVNMMLGSSSTPVDSVYSLAFYMNLDPLIFDTTVATITTANSWMGTNLLTFRKLLTGQVMMVLSRVDMQDATGYGEIGQLTLKTLSNFSGAVPSAYTLTPAFVKAITTSGSPRAFSTQNSQVSVATTTGINSVSIDNSIRISPNPNNGTFLLSLDQPSQQLNIEILDMKGMQLYNEQLKNVSLLSKEYNFNDLAKGVYLLKITTENGIAVKRIVIQ